MSDVPPREDPAPLLVLDIGGTKVAWAIAEPKPEPVVLRDRGTMPTDASRGGADLGRRVAETAHELVARHPDVRGVAMASAGVIDPVSGDVISATDSIPGWGGVPLGKLVADAAGLPVRVLNDVHAHGLGEALFGAGRGHRSVLVAAIGTGIGGAFVVDGAVATGAHHMAGHIGHVHHAAAAAVACPCGRLGHLEAIASGSGLAAWYDLRRGGEPSLRGGAEVGVRATRGDPLARDIITEAGHATGEVLGSLANCLDPDVVLLTGSVTRLGRPWWRAVRQGYAASAMDGVSATPLAHGELGGDAPLLGAAAHIARPAAASSAPSHHPFIVERLSP